jgi:hypothetical protein
MTRRLNLFYVSLEMTRQREARMRKVRIISVSVAVVCLVGILGVFYYQTTLHAQIDEVRRQKDLVNQKIDSAYATQLEYTAIATRVRHIVKLRKTEVKYMEQFAKVRRFLDEQGVRARIENFSTPDYQNFKFDLYFTDQNDLIQFVKAVEGGRFNATFKTLKLSGFTISTKPSSVPPSITVAGVFL